MAQIVQLAPYIRIIWRKLSNLRHKNIQTSQSQGLHMAKRKVANKEFQVVLDVVSSFPQGALFEEIFSALSPHVPRRTLQRRLALLVSKGKLEFEGETRSRKYRISHLQEKKKEEVPQEKEKGTAEHVTLESSSLSLSSIAAAIQTAVRQPIPLRKPVGYNRAFLDDYRPNTTKYLPEHVCKHLFEVGHPVDDTRPAGTYARAVLSRLLVDLSWNSSRLEGNTYSLLETDRLLKLNEVAEGKDLKEAQMILNHKSAIEFLVNSVDNIGINKYTILNLHALLSNDLLGDVEACGRLRAFPVGIGKSVYRPLSVPRLIEECFQQILDTANAIINPFEQAFFLMVHLPYLQPFEDVNKRVSRLAANVPLILNNLSPLSFVDVPQTLYVNGLLGVYELNKIELLREVFIWAYERSAQIYSSVKKELGEPDPFRMKNREMISETVREIVRGEMNKPSAIAFIRQRASEFVPEKDQTRFIEAIEKDLMGLHEGNMARHSIRPVEYATWQKVWLT